MPDEIFDRAARRRSRDRALHSDRADRWILARMADELLARLDAVRRPFEKALLIGGDFEAMRDHLVTRGMSLTLADPGFAAARAAGGVQCDEDRLPFADGAFDLILSIGTLDTVTDLPGALLLIRRHLRPDGVFFGAMAGAGSLPAFRKAMVSAAGVARFHPQVDVRAAGDLLGRAGFALPVADTELLDIRYRALSRLTADLRANGLRNVLAQRAHLVSQQLAEAQAAFTAASDGGRTTEHVAILYLTGWASAPKAIAQANR